MCDPVTGTMVALSVYSAYQQSEAEDAAINQQNATADLNEKMQLEQLEIDQQAISEQQTRVALKQHETAEDFAEEALDIKIQSHQDLASIKTYAFENMGGIKGGTVDSILANHMRGEIGTLNDIENNFMRAKTATGYQLEDLQREKSRRWYTARSNILSYQRSGKKSQGARNAQYVTSGLRGYGTGKSITRKTDAKV